jgi:hypothetical protein
MFFKATYVTVQILKKKYSIYTIKSPLHHAIHGIFQRITELSSSRCILNIEGCKVLPPYNQSFYIQPQTYSNIESGIPLRSFVAQESYQGVRSKGLARRESSVDPRMARFCFCMGYAILEACSQTDEGNRSLGCAH